MSAGFTRRAIVATVVSAATLMAGATAAVGVAARNPSTYSDPTGDSGSGPDIASVTISNTVDGRIDFDISIPTWKGLPTAGGIVAVFIDADRDESTGWDGFEYTLQTGSGISTPVLAHWDGSTFVDVAASWLTKVVDPSTGGVELELPSADLGITTGFYAWVATVSSPTDEQWADVAPDGDATYDYVLSMPRVVKASVRSAPSAPRAGRPFTVTGVTFTFQTQETVTARKLRCRATLAGRTLRGSGAGGCTFSLPRDTKGKRLTVAITAAVGSESVTVKSSFTVG